MKVPIAPFSRVHLEDVSELEVLHEVRSIFETGLVENILTSRESMGMTALEGSHLEGTV